MEKEEVQNENVVVGDTSAQRLEALSKTVEVVKDVFVQDIKVKDRIVEKCVRGIEKELDSMSDSK